MTINLTTPDLVTFYEFYALKIDHSLYLNHFENYHDCLNDVKAATALQPSYLKAIIRGKSESHLKI